MRLDDDVKRLESDLAKIGVSEKIREREALRALQEREWERGEAQTDHARVLREVGCRAEDAERECESLRKRVEDAEARADSAEVRSRDLTTKIETLERSAKDSARASKGSSLTAEINSSLREELERFFGRFEALKFSTELVDDFGFSLGDVRRRFVRVFALRECLLKPSHVTQRLLRLHLRVTQRGSCAVAFFRERVRGFLVRFFGE